jgi:hypothetical protein
MPYDDMDLRAVVSGVRDGLLRPPIPESAHPLLAELMGQCFERDPERRPPVAKILERLEGVLKRAATGTIDHGAVSASSRQVNTEHMYVDASTIADDQNSSEGDPTSQSNPEYFSSHTL